MAVPEALDEGLDDDRPETEIARRRGSRHLKYFCDVEALAKRMARWLHENGAVGGRFVSKRKMQKGLSLHRYHWWRMALSYLRRVRAVQIEGRKVTLVDITWGLDRKKDRPRRHRRRSAWFEKHLPEFLERDGYS